jgi:hypothetical protein
MLYKILTLLALYISFGYDLAFCQKDLSSKHTFRFFINETEQKIVNGKIKIIVDKDTIVGKKIGNQYGFPIIDKNKQFKIEVEVNKNKLLAGPFKAWSLNHGSRLIFGKLTQLNKLLSVAKYSSMDSTDKSWEVFSKRFFIINRSHVIDIENIQKIKELQFLIMDPNSDGDGVTFITQKVTKLKS